MDIKEMQTLKKQAERKIFDAIQEFSQSAGVTVDGIDFTAFTVGTVKGDKWTVPEISIRVTL